jgi:hypothetical protein
MRISKQLYLQGEKRWMESYPLYEKRAEGDAQKEEIL